MVMIIKFPIFLYNCPKLQKKDRKLTKNQRKKVSLTERIEFRREMEERLHFTDPEREQLFTLYKRLINLSCDAIQKDDCRKLKGYIIQYLSEGNIPRNAFGMNPIIKDMQTAIIVAEEIGMKRASILSIMLHEPVKHGLCSLDFVKEEFGKM